MLRNFLPLEILSTIIVFAVDDVRFSDVINEYCAHNHTTRLRFSYSTMNPLEKRERTLARQLLRLRYVSFVVDAKKNADKSNLKTRKPQLQ